MEAGNLIALTILLVLLLHSFSLNHSLCFQPLNSCLPGKLLTEGIAELSQEQEILTSPVALFSSSPTNWNFDSLEYRAS